MPTPLSVCISGPSKAKTMCSISDVYVLAAHVVGTQSMVDLAPQLSEVYTIKE